MSAPKSPRKGSLQYWPRKRASKLLPSVNWNAIKVSNKLGLKGFIGYKAGMASAIVKDNTATSMTKGKDITIPITIIECPPLKIFSVRFYKDRIVSKEILAENLDKELKRKLKFPKTKNKTDINSIKPDEYDDIRVICYSDVKKTGIKKTPDLSEIGISGSLEEKMRFIKENLHKEISIVNIFEKGQLIDLRGLTRGKGLSGPVKRFGITLKSHKSEKGQRRPGSLGPWNPSRVTFKAPMAGQIGMFTRAIYNNKIIDLGEAEDKKFDGIPNYGDLKTEYIIVAGSVQGPSKRQLIITQPLRKTKRQSKKDYKLVEVLR